MKKKRKHPTGSFAIFEPQDQSIVEFDVALERLMTDFEAPKL